MELFDSRSAPSERRAFARKNCEIPLSGLGTIRNIGLGGVFLESRQMPARQDIALTVPLDPSRFVIADAVVVNSRAVNGSSGYGLKFVNIDAESRRHILRYINEQEEHSPIEDDVRASLDQFISSWPSQYALVTPEFKKEVADFHLYLQQLKRILAQEERKLATLPLSDRTKSCSFIIEFYEKDLQSKTHQMILAIGEIIKDFTETEHALHRSYFQEQLSEFTNDSSFFNRAFNKPLGYAGDYLMMELLYHGLRAGESLWHQIINSCLTSIPLGEAVRNRAWYLSEKIGKVLESRRYPDIMSLACGPCEEVAIILEKGCPAANYCLVDQDPQALQYAKNKLTRIQFKTHSPASLEFRADSVKAILKTPDIAAQYPKMDLVYTAGLYDYLNEAVATKLTRVLWSFLKPGGQLIVGNFTRGDFSYFIEYGANWFLTYRNREDLRRIVPGDIAPRQVEIESESSGVNLFLCLRK